MRIEDIRRELENGKAPNADKITFSELAEQYLSVREGMGNHRENTLRKERSLVKHLLDGLGNTKLADITPAVISSLYLDMRNNGIGDSTLASCHGLLRRIMRHAVDNDLLS